MPYISYGNISKATAVAKKNLETLKAYLDQGYSVVSTEPTAVYMLREVYPTLVPGELAEKSREMSFPFFGFIQKRLAGPRAEARVPDGGGHRLPHPLPRTLRLGRAGLRSTSWPLPATRSRSWRTAPAAAWRGPSG